MLDALAPPRLPLAFGGAPSLNLASWHAQNPQNLANALMRAREVAPHLSELAAFLLPRLPRGVLCSSTIKGAGDVAFSRVMHLEGALSHRWLSFNTSEWTNTETVDCDHAQWRDRLSAMQARGLPPPAFVVASPFKGTAHLVWVYDQPFEKLSPGQLRVRKGIQRGLALALNGCTRFSNRLQKNPWHVRDDGAMPVGGEPGDPAQPGDLVTWAAYRERGAPTTYHTEIHRLRTVTAQELLTPLLAYADADLEGVHLLSPRPTAPRPGAVPVVIPGVVQPERNDFFLACAQATHRARTANPVTIRAIVSRTSQAWGRAISEASQAEIVGSISHWMTTKWRGPLDGHGDARPGKKPIDARVMTGEAADLGPAALAEWKAATVTERRQAAARRSAAHNQNRTRTAVLDALRKLADEGTAVTLATLAERAGVSLRSVKALAGTLEVPLHGGGQKVQNGLICLCAPRRGVRAPAKPGAPQGESLLPVVLLGEVVRLLRVGARQAERAEAVTVAEYAAAVARMTRPGALVETLRPLTSTSLRVRHAYSGAAAAQATAQRRADDRRRRAASRVRAEEREAWHQEHARDKDAWTNRIAVIQEDKLLAVGRVLLSGQSDTVVEAIHMMYFSILAAEHRARDRALGLPPPWKPKRRKLTAEEEAELDAIPW